MLKRPLQGVYLSLFLMMTLMILVSATWMGLYLAKRITRPVQMLAAGAREIGAGHLDHRIEPETRDEFGSLVEAFNTMAGELAASQRKLERSRLDLERKNLQLDERRRYIETVLERIATGVVSLGADGRIETINAAALRLLDVDRAVVGTPAERRVRARGSAAARPLLQPGAAGGAAKPAAQEIALAREGRELHLAAAATPLQGEDGAFAGAVLVFDDVTPLIRTQRVAAWRDVARRLAHEIKNPLTPIQLCAERMRRHFGTAPAAGARARRGVHDDDRRRGRIAQGAGRRVRAVRADAGAARRAVGSERGARRDAGALQRAVPRDPDRAAVRRRRCRRCASTSSRSGASSSTSWTTRSRRSAAAAPRRGPTASRRRSSSRRSTTGRNGVARIVVADNGPGISAADRDKLFMPYYSTKRRGSGLGLAIVRRIIAEHGGSIEVDGQRCRRARGSSSSCRAMSSVGADGHDG